MNFCANAKYKNKQKKGTGTKFHTVGFEWSWHEQVQFNTDLLKPRNQNLYTNEWLYYGHIKLKGINERWEDY